MKLGWKRSSGDLGIAPLTRTGNLVKLAAASPTDQHIIPEYISVYDQLSLQSCAANAGAGMWGILRGLEDKSANLLLSRLFLYWNARLVTQDTGKDEGTYIHNVMHSLTNMGACLETTWGYDVSKVFAQPSVIAYKQGDDNTFDSFYQILSFDNDRLLDIETAIRANHPVIFGTSVGAELENYTGGGKVFGPPTTSLGGHAMLIVGVRRNPGLEFYIRNSWGSHWGEAGHAWFSADYITHDSTADLFVGTKMAGLLL